MPSVLPGRELSQNEKVFPDGRAEGGSLYALRSRYGKRSAVRAAVSRVALRPRSWLSSTPELFGSPKDSKARELSPTLAR